MRKCIDQLSAGVVKRLKLTYSYLNENRLQAFMFGSISAAIIFTGLILLNSPSASLRPTSYRQPKGQSHKIVNPIHISSSAVSENSTGNTQPSASSSSVHNSTVVDSHSSSTTQAANPSSSSTTPPATSSAGFITTITHNGQVAPGTLIDYDPGKNYKVYYGGDLVFSQTNLYDYQGTDNINNIFTVSIPDGVTSNVPAEPYNDESGPIYPEIFNGYPNGIGYTGGSPTTGPGTSWIMIAALLGNPPPGVYTVHLTTVRTVSADGGYVDWEYDGFLTYTIYPES